MRGDLHRTLLILVIGAALAVTSGCARKLSETEVEMSQLVFGDIAHIYGDHQWRPGQGGAGDITAEKQKDPIQPEIIAVQGLVQQPDTGH